MSLILHVALIFFHTDGIVQWGFLFVCLFLYVNIKHSLEKVHI